MNKQDSERLADWIKTKTAEWKKEAAPLSLVITSSDMMDFLKDVYVLEPRWSRRSTLNVHRMPNAVVRMISTHFIKEPPQSLPTR